MGSEMGVVGYLSESDNLRFDHNLKHEEPNSIKRPKTTGCS